MYDMEHEITVKGTVSSVEWSNPHVLLYVDVTDDSGKVQNWTVETRGGPNSLIRAGWNKDAVKSGDQVTLTGHPARDRSHNMRLAKVVLADGRELDPNSQSSY